MAKKSLLEKLDDMNVVLGGMEGWICPIAEAGRLVAFSSTDEQGTLRIGIAYCPDGDGELCPIRARAYRGLAYGPSSESDQAELWAVGLMWTLAWDSVSDSNFLSRFPEAVLRHMLKRIKFEQAVS